MRRRVTVSLVGALVLLIVGSVGGTFTVSAGESGSLDSYLTSIGIDPDKAYFQEGLLNYAGPLCPDAGWNCTTDTSRPIVQTALAGGINVFECDPGINECTVVQREKGPDSVAAAGLFGGVAAAAPGQGPNNIAHCVTNDSGQDAAAAQSCEIIQTTPSGGKNSAVVTMIVNQNTHSANSEQTASQTATITQNNTTGANIASLTQKIKQLASTEVSGAVSQSQEATQSAMVTQDSTTGENSFKGLQSQVQQVDASSGAGITQLQNSAGSTPNAVTDVKQTSEDGPQSVVLKQSTDQTGNATSPGSVTQTQGAATGGNIEGKIHQLSGGVSTFDADQDEFQTLNATTGGTLTQFQRGPIKCCLVLSQLTNPANTLTLDQNSILTANAGGMLNPNADQTTTAITGFNTSGNGTANIHLQTNDAEFTDRCTGQTCFQVSRCEDDTCASSEAEVESGGAVAAGTGLRNRDTGNITITGIPTGAVVTRAVLIWGVLYVSPTVPPPIITFQGVGQTADAGQISGALCWNDTNTIGYQKDVTSLVTGNGTYTVSDPPRGETRVDNNPTGALPFTDGASLIVFFSGGGANDMVFSDFSYDTNTDAGGTIHRDFMVESAGAGADLILAGPDGQNNGSETFQFTGDGSFTLSDTWNGSDPQSGPSFPIGNLWDTDTYDVSSVLPAGEHIFEFDHIGGSDCIGVGAAVLVVNQPPVVD